MAESNGYSEIREGFICSICHKNLQSAKQLITHFEDLHSEEQDVLKSFKELIGKAKKKILNSDEQEFIPLEQTFPSHNLSVQQYESQEAGCVKSHTDLFKTIRRERLDHKTTETNRLILRLDRLLKVQGSDRKQQEQRLVAWLDGTNVTRCPSCTASFNITRRQHHCRLCGSIMCNNCSEFLSYETARIIVIPKYSGDSGINIPNKGDNDSIRICRHCMVMLENRRFIQMQQMAQPTICLLYEQLQKLKMQVQSSVELYEKMYNSLIAGNTTFHLQDAQSLKTTIAQHAKTLDTLSKNIALVPADPDAPKDYILTLPVLPTLAELEKIKQSRLSYMDEIEKGAELSVKKVTVPTGWSPNVVEAPPEQDEDPILQQMNIVRNYIEQARKAHRYEEIVSLEENLKLLKESYKQQQKQQS
ncbi:putative metal ion binding protein [Trypoxylus dichotomus]